MIRRLGPGDEDLLALLARDDPKFDLDERSQPGEPLAPALARDYLTDPSVLHWVAYSGTTITGFVLAHLLRLRSGEGREVLLYEIGVHRDHRRAGVGRALIDELAAWMREHGLRTMWVLADNPDAAAFYEACGFDRAREQPAYLIRDVG